MNHPIAININFDSLNENLGFPKGYRDPSFFEVFDRFMEFSNEYKFKFSIYIIGKDLENAEINSRVKDWSQAGHEIGNHSYSHRLNIGGLPEQTLRDEILKSHGLINNCIGKEPKGFICPGWSTSKKVVSELIKLNYLYDTSLFPSYLMIPMVIKNALNHIKRPDKFIEIINRKDIFYPFVKPLTPFFADINFKKTTYDNPNKITILPLPALNRSMALWHTLFFIFGESKTKNKISDYLNKCEYFYYLLHPADLIDQNDLEKDRLYTIERINVPLDDKKRVMREAFELFKNSGRPFVTMQDIAITFNEREKTVHNNT